MKPQNHCNATAASFDFFTGICNNTMAGIVNIKKSLIKTFLFLFGTPSRVTDTAQIMYTPLGTSSYNKCRQIQKPCYKSYLNEGYNAYLLLKL